MVGFAFSGGATLAVYLYLHTGQDEAGNIIAGRVIMACLAGAAALVL